MIGQTRDLEARHRDGHEIPVQLSLSSVEIDGRWHAVGVVRDVTEGKRIEQMLIHERTLLQTLMDTSPDHIYFKDADSRFTMISAAWPGPSAWTIPRRRSARRTSTSSRRTTRVPRSWTNARSCGQASHR